MKGGRGKGEGRKEEFKQTFLRPISMQHEYATGIIKMMKLRLLVAILPCA